MASRYYGRSSNVRQSYSSHKALLLIDLSLLTTMFLLVSDHSLLKTRAGEGSAIGTTANWTYRSLLRVNIFIRIDDLLSFYLPFDHLRVGCILVDLFMARTLVSLV